MIEFYKKRGETPLAALDRLRLEYPELKQETLSYAGRLDPMAEGILPVLVGKEENKNRKEFLNKDKIYSAYFLIGCESDAGDVLGIVQSYDFKETSNMDIQEAIKNLINIKKQTYPWYSSKTVNGIPLFEYARKGKFDIERPVRDICIYDVFNIVFEEVGGEKIVQECIEEIKKVEGDFRQEQIVLGWEDMLGIVPKKIKIVSCELRVSSGTYIRGLCEVLQAQLGVPVLLYKLIRTKVL